MDAYGSVIVVDREFSDRSAFRDLIRLEGPPLRCVQEEQVGRGRVDRNSSIAIGSLCKCWPASRIAAGRPET